MSLTAHKPFDDEHYHIPFNYQQLNESELEHMQKSTPYHHAMTALLDGLVRDNAFDCLNKTTDFKAFLSEHTY